MKLRSLYKLLCFATIIFTLGNCSKKAVTEFDLNKDEYSAGELVTVENKSKNVTTYRWTLTHPSGAINKFSETVPKIKLNPCAADGQYSLTLQGATQKGKTASVTKKFNVKTIRGYLYIYSNKTLSDTVTIKANGEPIGKVYGDTPLELEIVAGLHNLTATNGSSISVTINQYSFYPWNIGE